MKDDPKFQIELNIYEQKLLDFLKKNKTGFSKLQITEKTKMNKNTVEKYLDTLCNYGLIEAMKLKQGEKCYFLRSKNTKSFDQIHFEIKRGFDIRKSLIKESLKLLENSPNEEIISVYSNCIHWLFSFDKILKFSISANKQKKPVKLWIELEKEIQEFLDEVTTGISNDLCSAVLDNIDKKDRDILFELEYFIRNKNQKT